MPLDLLHLVDKTKTTYKISFHTMRAEHQAETRRAHTKHQTRRQFELDKAKANPPAETNDGKLPQNKEEPPFEIITGDAIVHDFLFVYWPRTRPCALHSGQHVLSQDIMLVTNLKYIRELYPPGEGTSAVCERRTGERLENMIDHYQCKEMDKHYAAKHAAKRQLRIFRLYLCLRLL